MAFQNIGLRVVLIGVGQFTRDVSSINNALNKTKQNMDSLSKKSFSISGVLDNVGKGLTSIGATITTHLSAPLAAASVGLIGFGIAFEDAFAGVAKTVDGVADRYGKLTIAGKELRDEIRQMGRDMPILATEIAGVTQAAGQLGVKGTDNLADFTKTAIMLGTATDFTAEQAAIQFAKLGNIMGVESKDLSKFLLQAGNATVALGNNFATTEPLILSMANRIAGAGRVVGLTTQEILGISAALSAMGVASEAGGSAVSRIFLTMDNASKSFFSSFGGHKKQFNEMEEQLSDFQLALQRGATADELIRDFQEFGILDLSGLEGDLRAVENGTMSMGEVIRDVRTRSITELNKDLAEGQKELKAFAQVTGLSEQAMASMIANDPDQAFLRFVAGLHRMNEAGEDWSGIAEDLGLSQVRVLELLNKTAPNLGLLEEAIGTSNTAWKEGTALQEEYQKKVATVASKIKILRNNVLDFGITLFDIVSPAITTIIDNITEFIRWLNTSVQTSDDFRDKFLLLLGGLIAAGPAIQALGLAVRGLGVAFKGPELIITRLLPFLLNPAVLIGIGLLAGAFLLIKNNIFGLGDVFSEIGGAVANFFSLLQNTAAIDELKAAFAALTSGDIQGFTGHLQTALSEFISWMRDFGIPLIVYEWNRIKPLIADAIMQAANWLLSTGSSLLGKAFEFLKTNFPTWAAAFWEWVKGAGDTLGEKLGELIDGVVTWVKDTAPKIVDKISEWADAFIAWVPDALPDLLKELFFLWLDLQLWLTGTLAKIVENLWPWVWAFVTWVADIFPRMLIKLFALWLKLQAWIIGIGVSLVDKVINEWLPAFIDWVKDIWPNSKEEWEKLWNDIKGWIEATATNIWNSAKEIGTKFIDGIKKGIEDNKHIILGALKDIITSIPIIGGEVWDKLGIDDSRTQPPAAPTNPNLYGTSRGNMFLRNLGLNIGAGNVPNNNTSVFNPAGSITTASRSISNSRSSTFAPTFNNAPITDQDGLERTLVNAFRTAQAVG